MERSKGDEGGRVGGTQERRVGERGARKRKGQEGREEMNVGEIGW